MSFIGFYNENEAICLEDETTYADAGLPALITNKLKKCFVNDKGGRIASPYGRFR